MFDPGVVGEDYVVYPKGGSVQSALGCASLEERVRDNDMSGVLGFGLLA